MAIIVPGSGACQLADGEFRFGNSCPRGGAPSLHVHDLGAVGCRGRQAISLQYLIGSTAAS